MVPKLLGFLLYNEEEEECLGHCEIHFRCPICRTWFKRIPVKRPPALFKRPFFHGTFTQSVCNSFQCPRMLRVCTAALPCPRMLRVRTAAFLGPRMLRVCAAAFLCPRMLRVYFCCCCWRWTPFSTSSTAWFKTRMTSRRNQRTLRTLPKNKASWAGSFISWILKIQTSSFWWVLSKMCVCLFGWVSVCMCIWVCECVHVCVYLGGWVCACWCIWVGACVCVYLGGWVCVWVGECVHVCVCVYLGGWVRHTPSTTFRHLPPNSAWIGYATEGALFISTHLSTDAVNTLQKVWVLIRLWKQPSAKASI